MNLFDLIKQFDPEEENVMSQRLKLSPYRQTPPFDMSRLLAELEPESNRIDLSRYQPAPTPTNPSEQPLRPDLGRVKSLYEEDVPSPDLVDPAPARQLSQSEQASQVLNDLIATEAVNKGSVDPKTGKMGKANFKGRLKDALMEALISAGQQVQQSGGVADWRTLGAALGGAAVGTADPATNEKRTRLRDIYKQERIVDDLRDQETHRTKIDNVYADNELNRQKVAALEQYRQTQEANKALGALYKGKIFTKSNPAHQAMARAAGLDPEKMTDWDFSNPIKTVVNGVTFVWDRETGTFDQSDLPVSEKDKLVDFEVMIPGEEEPRRFKVSPDRAASFAASMAAAGMQANLRRELQREKLGLPPVAGKARVPTPDAVRSKAQELGKDKTLEVATDSFKQIFFKRNKRQPLPAEIKAYLDEKVIPLINK